MAIRRQRRRPDSESKSRKTRVRPAARIGTSSAPKAAEPPEDLIPGRVHPPAELRRGPRKTRETAAPSPRLSNHKIRSQWFRARVSFPTREAPVQTLVAERDRVGKSLP